MRSATPSWHWMHYSSNPWVCFWWLNWMGWWVVPAPASCGGKVAISPATPATNPVIPVVCTTHPHNDDCAIHD